MIGHLALFAVGLVLLIVGAQLLVHGASRLALTLGISPLVVGLTVVAFGTSSPELAVSVGSALAGESEIAFGNVVGSNIFNVLFILGASAMITPLVVGVQIIRQEVPIMIGSSVLLLAVAADGRIGLWEGAGLVALLAVYVLFLIIQAGRHRDDGKRSREASAAKPGSAGWDRWEAMPAVQAVLIGAGLVLLVAGSRWLVDAATAIARLVGVSDLIIGLTIVAAGTSLPEVAASIAAAVKGERDIAVGNVVGSNTFNILGCLGLSALVAPDGLPVPSAVLTFDAWVMLAAAIACVPVFLTGGTIARWEGAVFLFYYVAYATYVVLAAQAHDALPAFSQTVLWFFVPITVLTLMVAMLRQRRVRG